MDFENAYESIEKNYLLEVLQKMNFPPTLINAYFKIYGPTITKVKRKGMILWGV